MKADLGAGALPGGRRDGEGCCMDVVSAALARSVWVHASEFVWLLEMSFLP